MILITRNKRLVVYILFVVLFILYVFNANTIVGYFVGDAVKKTNINEFPAKDTVKYIIEDYYSSNNMEGRVYFSGWAFCETKEDNANKKISLVFASDNNCYEYIFEPIERLDVARAFKNSKNIEGINHGFTGEFSTITMNNGVYELYIYDWENEKNYGIATTGLLYKVDSNGFQKYTWISSVIDVDITNAIPGQLKSCVDVINMNEDGTVNIRGWAFVNELNSKEQKVYLEITDSSGKTATYDTKPIDRIDVGDAYLSSKYNHSGYEALIPSGNIVKGTITCRIYVENNGTIYGPSIDYNLTI